VAVEQIKDQLKEMSANAALPPALQPLLTVPDDLKALRADLKVAKFSLGAQVTMTAYDAAAAERLDKVLRDGLKLGIEIAKVQLGKELDPENPVEKATLAYLDRVGNAFEEMLKPKREGTTLVMDIDGEVGSPAILVVLLMPAVHAAREAARRNMAMNNLRQMALAMHIHHDTTKSFPAAASYDKEGKPLLSWRVHMLPYLEQQALYDQFHLDEPWDSEHNKTLIDKMPDIYRNPNDDSPSKTNFLAVTGEGTVFADEKGISFADIRDGTSNTIMLVEANLDQSVIWTKPQDLVVNLDDPLKGLADFRPGGGFLAVFADGAARYISGTVDKDTLKALFTRAGGEIVGDF
jgi:hypothetical protein